MRRSSIRTRSSRRLARCLTSGGSIPTARLGPQCRRGAAPSPIRRRSISGRGYAQLVDPNGGPSRFDAVMRASASDCGSGVPYQVQYALRLPAASAKLWIEDTGRWFAGADGRPTRAHGVVRVINERHEREQRLAYLSRFDALTGEMNRWHMTEVLEAALEEAVKLRASCGFLLVAIDNLGRINEAYGFDVADEVIAAVAKRIRAPACAARTISAAFPATSSASS